jgi:hypothetical protein
VARSLISQIFSGLAYAAGGLVCLSILLSFLPSPCFPEEIMPPKEGLHLQFVHMALLTYSLDHEGKYPDSLKEIANDEVLRWGRGDVIDSKNLRYIRPTFSESDPYNQNNGNDIVLIYETDQWFSSVTINGTRNYHRKKILTKPSTQPLPSVTSDAEARSSPASAAPAVRGE